MEDEDDMVKDIVGLYAQGKWKEICSRYHGHPARSRVLWVFPSEENFAFLGGAVRALGCARVLSVGCGSGLLEGMLHQATGLSVFGIEVDGAWWCCRHAPPTFIPLLLTSAGGPAPDDALGRRLRDSSDTALLFCYFNNRPAFEEYLRQFSGSALVVVGPGAGKGVHTDPRPFGDVGRGWTLHASQEVRDSLDFIAIYRKDRNLENPSAL